MKFWKNAVIFYIGGMLYTAIELLWRGWTHGSMFVLGGICFCVIGSLDRDNPRLPVLLQMVVGALLVTVLEFFSGLLLNRMLRMNVWDYSAAPYNLFGQICLPFVLLWFPLCGIAVLAEDGLRRLLFGEPMPDYVWL
jgi:uncharacterized membrane protein